MNTRLVVLFVIASIIGLSACKKNNDAPVATLKSSLNVINASPDAVNFYLNGTRLNNNSNLSPLVSTGYLSNVPVGSQNFQIKKTFDPVTNTVQSLYTVRLNLDTGKYYSLFLAGETSDQAFSILDFTTADLGTLGHTTQTGDTAQTTSYVRFVNASPGTGNLDFSIGDTVSFKNVPFKSTGISIKSAGGFTLVNSGLKSINVYVSGSATPTISGHILLSAGNIYTLYSKGALTGTGDSAFGVGVTLNGN